MKSKNRRFFSSIPPLIVSAKNLLVKSILFLSILDSVWGQELVRLREGWEVIHEKLLSPQSFPEEASPIELPENNHEDRQGRRSSQIKVSTYRIRLCHLESDQLWGLIIPDVFSSYSLYFDGARIGEMGYPSITAGSYRARVQPRVYFFQGGNDLELLLQVTNFHVNGDKIRQVPLLGRAEDVRRYLLWRWGVELFLIVFLFAVGSVLIVLPESYKPWGSQLLGLFFLTMSLRVGFTGWKLFLQLFPFLEFEMVSDLGYALASLGASLFVGAMFVRLRQFVDFYLTHVVLLLNVLGFITVVIIPTADFETYSLMFDLGMGLAIAWSILLPVGPLIKRQKLDPIFWISYSFLPLAAFVDYVVYGGYLRDEWFFQYGILLFAIGHLVNLAFFNAGQEKHEIDLFLELSETTARRHDYVNQFQHHLRTPVHALLSFLEKKTYTTKDATPAKSIYRILTELNRELEKLLKPRA